MVKNGLTSLLDANPGMKLVKTYKLEMPGESMTSVHLVREGDKESVVKIASKDETDKYLRSAKNQVLREDRVLRELNGFYNSPKHMGFYDMNGYIAVAKENLEFEYMDSWKGKGKDKYLALKKMVEAFHDRGVSGLDLQIPRNIAILDWDKNDLTLFDFGKSVLKSDNPSEYEVFKNADNEDFYRMFAR